LREKVYIKLRQADSFLPQGYYFKIHDAYRDTGKQKKSWINRIHETRQLYPEESVNRNILQKAMIKAGFKNYPSEWWHFCFEDKMWAAYSRKSKCFYGYIDRPEL
jgi:D-alanyl-D-alanine dipeptidase